MHDIMCVRCAENSKSTEWKRGTDMAESKRERAGMRKNGTPTGSVRARGKKRGKKTARQNTSEYINYPEYVTHTEITLNWSPRKPNTRIACHGDWLCFVSVYCVRALNAILSITK